ncbi:Co2+/Mg2+ efflux protein ApaG [Pontibacter sp. G13]|uniref:Co2+/Mg2+ efflux protein ApaG n=1 Tax=Pontibacter sp. G13 TaxID=3074898 RepID=UPI00288B04A7|nr:Co2+/Mg2+ efflux protein ApaG [Pontibacter sp. G13]WNJ16371.1 Co2+/Mg2+ efflux protein ApaG [Pontibacter sp. G13]
MESRLNTAVTQGIRVNVRTTYIKDESAPGRNFYVFAYQVEIINESPYSVKLLTREWNIVDGIGQKRVVKGEGVIGQQPVIQPGEQHRYVSGSHFQTPIGRMSGHYVMAREVDGDLIQVEIPPFLMMVPCLSN